MSTTNLNDPLAPSLEKGLRSLQSIRWLLLAGALVSAVSVYRLLESQWDGMTAVGQFSTLTLGSLLVFATGNLLRGRLRLPYAGSALLFLFTGLVPVLAWGAAYLELLRLPLGWPTFIVGMGTLLWASTHVLKTTLRYQGIAYPLVFGALTLSLPLLPRAKSALMLAPEFLYVAAAMLLGALVYFGSLHINRFLFHRDRRDGVDRPVHVLPFLVLIMLYMAAMVLLDPQSTFIALPLMVIGMVLVGTGEEYYWALVQAMRSKSASWPNRSVAFLSLGFSFAVIAGPLSLLDPNMKATALTSAAGAWLFLGWALRYESRIAHLGGAIAAFFAYQFSPSLFPMLATQIANGFKEWASINAGNPALPSFFHLGFLVLLLAFGVYLLHRNKSAHIRRAHGILTALHGSALVALALLDIHGGSLFLPVGLAVLVTGMFVTRRAELLVASLWAWAATVVVWSATVISSPTLVAHEGSMMVGVSFLVLVALGSLLEPRLASCLQIPLARARQIICFSAVAVAGCVVLNGLYNQNWVELVLAGVILFVSGHRLPNVALIVAGFVASSLGTHGLVHLHTGDSLAAVSLTTQAWFIVSWVIARIASNRGGSRLEAWEPGAKISVFLHGAVGLLWILPTVVLGMTVEPVMLLLVGFALADWGLRSGSSSGVFLGVTSSIAYVPLHLAGAGWVETLPTVMTVAAAALTVVAVATDWSRSHIMRRYRFDSQSFSEWVVQPLHDVYITWTALAIVVCLTLSGAPSLILALTLVAMGLARYTLSFRPSQFRWPLWSILIAMAQLLAIIEGATTGILLQDLMCLSVLPLGALFAFGWLLLLDYLGREEGTRPSFMAAEVVLAGSIAFGYLAAFATDAAFLPLEHTALIGVALAFAFRQGARSWHEQSLVRAWEAQGWLGLAVLHGFTAGWLQLGQGVAPYAILASGVIECTLADLFKKQTKGKPLFITTLFSGQALALAAGSLAIQRTFSVTGEAVLWPQVLPLFLVSLFYLIVTSRQSSFRTAPALLSALFLGVGLAAVGWARGVGGEFYSLAPGVSLLSLSYLLRREMGPTWSRNVFAGGAAFIYATPVLALYDEVTWSSQAVLLLMTVAFGASSFVLRSRSLLTVSTAAMLIDLACFVIKIRETEPLLLWAGGLVFGMALISFAAYLEYQREGLAQQIRVFGKQLQCWH